MSRRPAPAGHAAVRRPGLKDIADRLGLSVATVSVVISDAPAARAISQDTKDRILKVAAELRYRPNFFARSLRTQRSFTVAVVVPEISDGYAASVIGGIEERLLRDGYLYFVASHRGRPELMQRYPELLMERGFEGFILVNTPIQERLSVPVVAIGGHQEMPGVTNVTLHNEKAARLAVEHLAALGHRQIAFFKGHRGSADTAARWRGIQESASAAGIPVRPKLTLQLQAHTRTPEPSTPDEGYAYGQKLLAAGIPFTALVAFNDMSALGAIRAFQDAGLRVPQDVSVVGFDDIQAAAFHNPRLTTVRQPMRHMGEVAAAVLLERLSDPASKPNDILVDPELVTRESTAPARKSR